MNTRANLLNSTAALPEAKPIEPQGDCGEPGTSHQQEQEWPCCDNDEPRDRCAAAENGWPATANAPPGAAIFDKGPLVPDPEVCRRYSITTMTLWRWSHDPELGFPKAVKIAKRNYRYLSELTAFELRCAARAAEAA